MEGWKEGSCLLGENFTQGPKEEKTACSESNQAYLDPFNGQIVSLATLERKEVIDTHNDGRCVGWCNHSGIIS